MRSDQRPSQVALLVNWPAQPALEPLAQEVARRIADRRLVATWSVEEPRQASLVAGWTGRQGAVDAALLCPSDSADSIARRVKNFHAAGVSVLAIDTAAAGAAVELRRALHGTGIRAAIVGATAPGRGEVRALPLGWWQFSPRVVAPAAGMWQRWFGRAQFKLPDARQKAVTLVSLDMPRLIAAGGQGWRDVERLLDRLEDAQRRSLIAVTTVGAATLELAGANSARPQRSILRAA